MEASRSGNEGQERSVRGKAGGWEVGKKYIEFKLVLQASRLWGDQDCTCANADHGVGSSLHGGPSNLEEVEATVVANLASDAISRLGDGMPVQGQRVILLQDDVE